MLQSSREVLSLQLFFQRGDKMYNCNFLVVDDEPDIRNRLKGLLEDNFAGSHVLTGVNGVDAITKLKSNKVDVIISDMKMDDMNGMDLLCQVKKDFPDIHFIMITAFGTIDSAVQSMKKGAFDFITKPLTYDHVTQQVTRCLKMKEMKDDRLKSSAVLHGLIYKSEAMKNIVKEIENISLLKMNVLITGESGVGKELVARLIHYNHRSERKNQRFVPLNCSAITQELIESELFGHEKGSFTGAFEKKKGKFELADSGTLFLDEIGDMSLQTQAKVLRVIETQEFQTVGGSADIKVDVRVISATNKILEDEIKESTFRQDLYYRISTHQIHIPPLRERKEDISELAKRFVVDLATEYEKNVNSISSDAITVLAQYSFPGNVRELRSIISRAVLLCDSYTITSQHLEKNISRISGIESQNNSDSIGNITVHVAESFAQHGCPDRPNILKIFVEGIIDQYKDEFSQLCSKLTTTSLCSQINTTPDKINRAVKQSSQTLFYAVIEDGKVKKCVRNKKPKNCFIYSASKLTND